MQKKPVDNVKQRKIKTQDFFASSKVFHTDFLAREIEKDFKESEDNFGDLVIPLPVIKNIHQ